MVVNNNARKQRLINYLFNFALDNDIGFVSYKAEPRCPSLAWKSKREIGINMNWHNQAEIPFTIAHEIGHIMDGNPNLKQLNCCVSYGTQYGDEKPADIYGLHLLYQYSCAQEDNFYDPLAFIKAYGIPMRMFNEAYKMFQDENKFYTFA